MLRRAVIHESHAGLLYAARLLEDHPGLMQLRLLQVVAQDAALPGTTRFVVNLPDGTASSGGDS